MTQTKKVIFAILGMIILTGTASFLLNLNSTSYAAKTDTVTKYKIPAKATTSNLSVRKTPGTKGELLKVSKKAVKLAKSQKVTVRNQKVVSKLRWYYVSFTYKSKTRYGWVSSDYIKLTLSKKVKATVNSSTSIKIRTKASSKASYLKVGGKVVSVKKSKAVKIYYETTKSAVKWFKISFSYSGKTVKGYIPASKVTFSTTESSTSTPTVTAAPTPAPTEVVTTSTVAALTDAEFEAALVAEGFPESYKPALRALHVKYPYWQFKAFQTNLDWETSIIKENTFKKNLISKGSVLTASIDPYAAWKSFAGAAYDWTTDKFTVCDGNTWVTASETALRYYMDPRNFLDETNVFQFETLLYQNQYQTRAGVEKLLLKTPLSAKTISYTDPATNGTISTNYEDIFMNAASYSGVSPYHLVSRVKQEVFTKELALSGSATGKYAGYEGYYNFFNIGAYQAAGGGAIANGLTFAKNGITSVRKDGITNAKILIPWTNPYCSILGGSYFIGGTYMNIGQNTIYLEKFNVTNKSTYLHQYMGNVEAPSSESKKTYVAYVGMTDVPIVFSIPVYLNMPEATSLAPTTVLNPNNWLKTLSISGQSLTPTFDTKKDQEYSLIVDNTVTAVELTASAVSSKAVIAGAGIINLVVGDNVVTISVTAENGTVRNYILHIVRN